MVNPTAALVLLVMASGSLAQQAEVVNTTLGAIRGLRRNVLGTDVDIYYGIPFAKAPVGDLRFKRPEPAEPWTEVKATVTKPNACFQTIDTAFGRFSGVEMWNPNTPLSEDCLYLNVWVPRGSESPNTTMVWIYGGGFYSGSSALDVYDASKLAVTQNVIVASMNYRVGPLGFLYTGTADAPGNQGLLDQSLALKWIHDNVARFGGRPDSITIFGESAGAISVGLHLLSPVSRDLFTRAIMQSGAPIDQFSVSPSVAIQRAAVLLGHFGCLGSGVQCLRGVDAGNITDAQWSMIEPGFHLNLPTMPVVDGVFLTESPSALLAKGVFKDTQLLIGTNKDEGSYFVVYDFPDLFPLDESHTMTVEEFKNVVHSIYWKSEERVDKAVIFEYVEKVVPDLRESYQLIAADISGDRFFICAVVDFAAAFASMEDHGRDVYLYSFHHRLSSNEWPAWMGVMHGYEIEAVFGLTLNVSYTQDEHDLADRMMAYWARFAHTGNPNGQAAVTWPKLTPQGAEYLVFNGSGDVVQHGLRYEQCAFKRNILPLVKQQELQCPPISQDATVPSSSFLLLLLITFSAPWISGVLTKLVV